MTQVWMTLRGCKYHRTADCPGIIDGHQQAAARGLANYPARPLDLRHAVSTAEQCLRCWRDAVHRDRWLSQALNTELNSDSTYELDFYNSVLRHVTGLDPDQVRVQHAATGASGNRYYLDFAILRPGLTSIAIEIDGFSKCKEANEAAEVRQGSMSARQNDLTAQGWTFLRFTNRQVTTAPGSCRNDIETTLRGTSRREPILGGDTTGAPLAHGTQSGTSRYAWVKWVVAAAVATPLILTALAFALGHGGEQAASQSVSPPGSGCPTSHPVKGNMTETGEQIYHLPGWRYYTVTVPEKCFRTARNAQGDGFRPSKVQ